MILLRPEHHDVARPLLASLQHQLIVESVLDRHTLGRAYVDDPAAPAVGALWTLMDAVLCAGTPDEATLAALHTLILDKMAPDARSRHVPHFAFMVGDAAWVGRLLDAVRLRRGGGAGAGGGNGSGLSGARAGDGERRCLFGGLPGARPHVLPQKKLLSKAKSLPHK